MNVTHATTPDGCADSGRGGVLVAADEAGCWAWTGVRLVAAIDLTDLRDFAGLSERERLAKAVAEQTSFLASHVGQPDHTPLELRWIWEPTSASLTVAVLTRVWGPDEPRARLAAAAALGRLRALPRHVAVAAVDESTLHQLLSPFTPHPSGAIEIRKRVLTARPQRPDARVEYYFAVQPYPATTRSWEPVLSQLVAQTRPVMVSVGVEPSTVPATFREVVGIAASEYGRLATGGDWNHGLYGRPVKLTADAFAVEAQNLYNDAARRYQDRGLRLRVAIASPEPLTDDLARQVGNIMTSTERGEAESYLSSDSVGSAFTLERPGGDDLSVFNTNLASLAHTDWGGHEVWRRPNPPHAALRTLTWIVDPEEAASAFRLPVAVHGTLPGLAVRSRPPAVVSDYVAGGAHVRLGQQVAPTRRDASVLGVELEDLTRHALFVGTTGSGKTNSTLALCQQLWGEHRIPFLVFEPVNSDRDDYRWLGTLPGFEDLLVLTVGDESVAPLRLNPFEVPVGVRVSTHIGNLRACFDAAFGLWDPLPALYMRALRETYARAGFDPSEVAGDSDEWPVLADFVAAIAEVVEGANYAGEVGANITAAATLRAQSLAEGPCGAALSAARSFPIADLLSRPVIVELAAIGDDQKEQALMMALMLTTMTEHYKTHRRTSQLAHVTVIEEAHRLMGRPDPAAGRAGQGDAQAKAAEAFANTLAENRKYGEGLVVVEQSPSKLVADAVKNTNLKVMHTLSSEEERTLLGDTMRFSEDQKRFAGVLPKMHAFVFNSRLDRPAYVAVDDVRAADAASRGLEMAPLANRTELARRHAEWVARSPVAQLAMAPQAPCGTCPVSCSLERPAGRAVAARGGEFAAQLKAWPKAPGGRPEWWSDLITWLDDVGEEGRPRRVMTGDSHWRVALFVAAFRAKWPTGDMSRWLPLLRSELDRQLVASTTKDAAQ